MRIHEDLNRVSQCSQEYYMQVYVSFVSGTSSTSTCILNTVTNFVTLRRGPLLSDKIRHQGKTLNRTIKDR